MADLQRLRDFIASLQPTCRLRGRRQAAPPLLGAAQRGHAIRRGQDKGQLVRAPGHRHGPIGNEFDVYLSALGFMPVDGDLSAAQAQAQVHQAQVQQAHAAAAATQQQRRLRLRAVRCLLHP
ncbi:hypothetical protein F5883DRAFT_644198 [Diaporthe sp. PMI_573]|nr:hypothetical protein F5883DRAFT_644198 [Diaporthaceae sp. PMI_573]